MPYTERIFDPPGTSPSNHHNPTIRAALTNDLGMPSVRSERAALFALEMVRCATLR